MGKRLMFDDIDEWTPSSISIVDEPFHPLCHFEVYEDDEEYVKKSIEINDGEIMVKEQPVKEEEQMVSGPVSFFKEILSRNVGKSDDNEVPAEEDEKPTSENGEILKLLRSFDARLKKLEEKQEPTEPVKEAVAKSEGETEEAEETPAEEEETTSTEETTEEAVDEEEVVTKSIDPDLATEMSTPEESFCKRMGRKENGMTW